MTKIRKIHKIGKKCYFVLNIFNSIESLHNAKVIHCGIITSVTVNKPDNTLQFRVLTLAQTDHLLAPEQLHSSYITALNEAAKG